MKGGGTAKQLINRLCQQATLSNFPEDSIHSSNRKQIINDCCSKKLRAKRFTERDLTKDHALNIGQDTEPLESQSDFVVVPGTVAVR